MRRKLLLSAFVLGVSVLGGFVCYWALGGVDPSWYRFLAASASASAAVSTGLRIFAKDFE